MFNAMNNFNNYYYYESIVLFYLSDTKTKICMNKTEMAKNKFSGASMICAMSVYKCNAWHDGWLDCSVYSFALVLELDEWIMEKYI